MPDLVEVRRDGDVVVLTLQRPEKLNALSTAVEERLLDAVGSLDVRSSRAVVVAGSGTSFSAGADVHEMREQTPASILEYYRATGEVYEHVASLRMPTVAAIHGYCLGGGFELALACDFRVADTTAVFGLPEVGMGILPSSGGTHRLVRAVGVARAKELLLLRDRLGPEEMAALGLVTLVVPEGRALARATEMAHELASLPPLAVEVAKRAADAAAESSRETGILIERLAYALLSQTEEHGQSTTAFARREPS